MLTLAGYENLIQIHESDNSLVYRARRTENNQPVVLKFLNQDYPTAEQIRRYKQEYHLTCQLDSPGIVKAYSLEEWRKSYLIVLEDFGAISLKEWLLQREKLTIEEFLLLAIATAESLGEIHAVNIIHKDINPANIVFNPETKELKIIDFGISTQLSRENPTLKNPKVLEGTLAYISPEQTGRMNRSLDYRTDFYSLGVTFYKMLTGKLPFETEDDLELVHCHLAKKPLSLSEIDPSIPPILSEIVMKLMAKNAEDRYQSSWRLKADLETCLNKLETTGKIENFVLGSQDISDKFQIPQKLYGREAEIETLITAFERVKEQSELMLVAGYSGIGKSALVQEIYKPITEKRGYFIAGKFEQFQRNIPYSAMVTALRELVDQLLTETEEKLNSWKTELLQALAVNGQVIIDVIPELELVIGKQAAVQELEPNSAQNRFNLVFQSFIRACCTKEHPLVIFLDDLQWADGATLKLIELMTSDVNLQDLFLICVYRDNEVSLGHPFKMMLNEVSKTKAIINQISLSNLGMEDVSLLMADTLKSSVEEVKGLAKLVLNKTEGNPFFVNQFLNNLYAEKLLIFNRPEQKWEWDLEQIERENITDNVVELMVGKLQKLPRATQKNLEFAACIGASFDLDTLSILEEKSPQEVFADLIVALESGLILPLSELDDELLIKDYQFLHDRIQQAAYSSIAENKKQSIHLKIARILSQKLSVEEQQLHLFTIVDRYNEALEKIVDIEERNLVLELNIAAGEKAKSSAAYEAALQYYQTALSLLPNDSWQQNYPSTLKLYEANAEAAYLTGNFAKMDALIELVLNGAEIVLDRVKVQEIKIQALIAQSRQLDALDTGIALLELLGIEIPDSPEPEDLQAEIAAISRAMTGKSVADLARLPLMEDANQLAKVNILNNLLSPCYQAKPSIFPLLVCKQMHLLILYGNMSYSSHIYSCYAMICILVLQDFALARQYAELACQLDLSSQTGDGVRGTYTVGACLLHYSTHVKETLPLLLKAYQAGLETGDFQFGALAIFNRAQNLYFIGDSLLNLKLEMTAASDALTNLNRGNTLAWSQTCAQAVLNLLGESEVPWELVGTAYDETKSIPLKKAANDRSCLHFTYLHKLILCYLFEQIPQAVENAAFAESYLDGVVCFLNEYVWNFYDSLAQLAYYSQAEVSVQKNIIEKIRANQTIMQHWVTYAPANGQHKYDLVAAELHRILEERLEAIELYDRAIAVAKENEYIQEEAIANELAAKFYLDWGREKVARVYMMDAHYCYSRWGATAKVKHLEENYPQLLNLASATKVSQNTTLRNSAASNTTTKISTTTSSNKGEMLDIGAVMKASLALSGEIVFDKLLATLMKIAIENAGAQKGYLLLQNEAGQWSIEAEGRIDTEEVATGQSQAIDNNASSAIINYVARTQKSVVLADAAKEGQFTRDAYILATKPKSILSTPLVNQGKLSGILYLENNLATGAFTRERTRILQVLSGQAAIAIDNARLYNELEDKVEKRTAQLAEATREAKAANEAKSAFLANMSHELRTPLNAILGFSQLLIRAQTLAPTEQENVGIIARSGEHLLALINQVLDLSKIEAGRITLNPKNFDLYRLLDDIEDLLGLKASEKGLQLVCDRDDNTPRYLNTDEMKLRQVLINLLNNAIKFTEEGGVAIRVRQKAATDNRVELEFEIEDTGAGIAPEEIDSLFEAFVQTESGKQSQEGTGLGLPISRKFVELMGGDIVVTSQVGRGTTFKFNIEATTAESEELEVQKPKRRAIALAPKQPRYRLLVVDDKPINCQLLLKLLVPFGFEVKEAANGREAVDIYSEWQPDLIFMDLRMPVMDGYEATRQIKTAAGSKPCAVVAVTASVLEEQKAVVLEAGCDDFIRKPFKDGEIFEAIARHLGAEFIYEDLGETSPNEEEVLTAQELAALSQELLTALEEALLTLDPEVMQEVVDAIADNAPVVARQLESLANSFAYQEILDLIEESKSIFANG